MAGRLFIGTSGFGYPDWQGRFYPEGLPRSQWLAYYARVFNSLELNVTFYRTPKPAVFEGWARAVPADFAFVVKGPRFMTHIRKLEVDLDICERFSAAVRHLEERLSCALWQLPPSLRADAHLLEAFLETLRNDSVLARCRHAIEFRHRSWFDDDIYAILARANVAAVAADSGGRFPFVDVRTADFAYFRFHGPAGLYTSSYSGDELARFAESMRAHWENGDVYAFFNNDARAYAIENALTLKGLLKDNDLPSL